MLTSPLEEECPSTTDNCEQAAFTQVRTRPALGRGEQSDPDRPIVFDRQAARPGWVEVAGYAFFNWSSGKGGEPLPTGMPRKHVVRRGDSLSKIASAFGVSPWQCIYDQKLNAALVAKRPNPNLILPGDALFVPLLCSHGKAYGPLRAAVLVSDRARRETAHPWPAPRPFAGRDVRLNT